MPESLDLSYLSDATEGHLGLFDVQGHYLGGCACGWEGTSGGLIDHIDDIITAAVRSKGGTGDR